MLIVQVMSIQSFNLSMLAKIKIAWINIKNLNPSKL